MNRIKNIYILLILFLFFIVVQFLPVVCLFKQVTGISCPACGMTRAFYSILHLHFLDAVNYNLLSIPLFIFIIYFVFRLIYDIFKNQFSFIPQLLNYFSDHYIFIFSILFISFIFNNIK
ncbi:MAG: DUF2752 domain-containing protein [Clostridia bacterium]|jgi:hypothetical protein|nr:hypothetical protein [Clostridiales bacterium]